MEETLGRLAAKALLWEVEATPKPGLVDMRNSGSHTDMDMSTFLKSIDALEPHFIKMAKKGIETAALPESVLFFALREMGKEAEKDMFSATLGVNTHKGALFSLGLLCGAAGRCLRLGELSSSRVCITVGDMARGICEKELAPLKKTGAATKGEQCFLRYGERGARGQAEDGYKDAVALWLPYYKDCKARGLCRNEALVRTLLYICTSTMDTNILCRADMATALRAREAAARVFENYSYSEAVKLDDWFINQKISPGGSADLLSVVIYLDFLDELCL